MAIATKLALRLLRPFLRHWTREALVEDLSSSEIEELFDEVLGATGRSHDEPSIEREPSFGGRLMLTFAAMTFELHEGLRRRGFDEARSRHLTAGATWAVYRRMAKPPWWIARLTARGAESRLRRATRVFRRFPFGPPAYRMEDKPSVPGTVAFDVRRCPVAESFRDRDRVELCRAAWCDLDHPLATLWGARLERTRTLVEGADSCDFRWIVRAHEGPQ